MRRRRFERLRLQDSSGDDNCYPDTAIPPTPVTPFSEIHEMSEHTHAGDDAAAGQVARGACLCGAVQFEVTMPSKFCAHCHCSNCRRAHGAAFVTWAGFAAGQFEIVAGAEHLTRYRTDTDATRSFCAICGSTLTYEGPRWEGEVHVARANIEGDIDRAPGANVYVDHRASWWEISDGLPRFGGESGVEPKDA
jgi:hypothetical protein